jgi:hypothetical protein
MELWISGVMKWRSKVVLGRPFQRLQNSKTPVLRSSQLNHHFETNEGESSCQSDIIYYC